MKFSTKKFLILFSAEFIEKKIENFLRDFFGKFEKMKKKSFATKKKGKYQKFFQENPT